MFRQLVFAILFEACYQFDCVLNGKALTEKEAYLYVL